MARKLLKPIGDQDLFSPRHGVSACRQSGKAAADYATGFLRWTRIRGATHRSKGRSNTTNRRIVRIEHIYVGCGRKIRMERHAEQPAIPKVVYVGPEIREYRRSSISEVIEDLDQTAFLANENPAIGRKLQNRRFDQTREYCRLLKSRSCGCEGPLKGRQHPIPGNVVCGENRRVIRGGTAENFGWIETNGARRLVVVRNPGNEVVARIAQLHGNGTRLNRLVECCFDRHRDGNPGCTGSRGSRDDSRWLRIG